MRLIVLVESDVCERWLAAGVFEAMAQDLRALLRVAAGRSAVQEATDESVERSYVDQGYTGENASEAQDARRQALRRQTSRGEEGLYVVAQAMGG